MKKYIIFILLLLFNKNFSQINFSSGNTIIDKTHYSEDISSIVSVDLNNDGFKEIIVSSSFQNRILLYKNINGDIQYNQRVIIYDTPLNYLYSYSYLNVSDLDNDGLQDIVVANSQEDRIYWFKNLGNFVFANFQIIASNIDKPTCIVVGDIDNDGDQDIITGIYNDENISIFKNNGNAIFNSQLIVSSTNYGPNKVALVDIDNNGFLDIINGQEDGSIYLIKNNDGTNYSQPIYITGSADNGTGFDFLDINNDNFVDIVYSSNYANNIKYSLNVNGNNFNSQTVISNNIQYPYQIICNDLNNDGKKDIVVSGFANGNSFIGWFKNNNNGNFSPIQIIVNNISNPKSFIIDDLNQNNKPEIISSSYDSSMSIAKLRKLSVFEYNVSQSLYNENILNFTFGNIAENKMADIDNDGNMDLLTAFHNCLVISKNIGQNQFSSYKTITEITEISGFTYDLETGDFNNDGYIDIMIITRNGIEILKNNGNLTFTSLYNYPIQPTFSQINSEIGDLNNDGKIDYILSYVEAGQTKLFKFLQTNYFNFQSSQINITNLNNIKIADLDNDNKIDIIGSLNSNFVWLRNDGLSNFSQQPPIPMPLDADTVMGIGDIDNDNDLDLICSSSYSYDNRKIYYIKNNSGIFYSPILIDNQGFNSLQLGDIDNDGLLDIVGTYYKAFSPYNEILFYYKNINGSSFGNINNIESLGDANNPIRQLSLVDLNNDNKLDIISGYSSMRMIKLYTNLSILSTYENQLSKDFLNIYPNPSSYEINWNLKNDRTKNVEIIDYTGKIVLSKKIEASKIIINNLNSGIYFLVIHTFSNKKYVSKFIKE